MAKEQTTVTIDRTTAQRLERLSTKSKIPKKVFLDFALSYLERYGIDPTDHENPTAEMQKIVKRIEQIVSFIRVQEKDILNPMFEAITKSEARINLNLENLEKVPLLSETYDNLLSNLKEYFSNQKSKQEKDREALLMIAQALEGNNDREGLTGRLKNLFG